MSRNETADKGRETSSPRPLKKTLPILVADDDPVSRHLLVKTLQSWGHKVRTTDDGQKAWEMFKNGEVRLILTEWMLPGMDGVELCHRIRAASTGSSKPAYIVLLTSKNSVQDRVAAFNAGADDFISKPLRAERLFACMTKLLGVHYEYTREPDPPATDTPAPELSSISLPGDLLDALRQAVSIQSITRLRRHLDDLEELGDEARQLATHLRELSQRYDLKAIGAALEKISNE